MSTKQQSVLSKTSEIILLVKSDNVLTAQHHHHSEKIKIVFLFYFAHISQNVNKTFECSKLIKIIEVIALHFALKIKIREESDLQG